MSQNDLITTQEAAKRLNLSMSTIARLVRAGQLNAEKKTLGRNSPYLVSAASVEAFRQKRQRAK